MDYPGQSFTFLQRLSLRVACYLFVGLFSFLGLKLAREWIRTNHYLVLAALLIAIGLLSLILTMLRYSSVSSKRLRWGVFLLTSVSSLIFLVMTPLPITSVMIEVHRVPRSMEFFLQHHDHETRGKWRSVYRARGDSHTKVFFLLPRPIRGHDERLRIYMGRNPHRLHFDRYPPAVEIETVAFGTDVFSLPLSFTVYSGRELSPEAGVISHYGVASFRDGRLRAWKIAVMWDEGRVRKDSIPMRIALIKLLWAILYFGLSAATIWSGSWLPKMKPVGKAIEKYLMQLPG